jgi:hypothetical protein
MRAFDLKAAANAAGYRIEYDDSADIRGEDETLAWYSVPIDLCRD